MRPFLAGNLIRCICAGACWALLAPQCEASDHNKPLTEYTHTVWTHKEGLPSAFIYSIAQTQDGYIWLGTADGIVRFDGIRFLHWRPKSGYTTLLGTIRIVRAARDGSLWVGTASGLVGHVRGDNLSISTVGAQVQGILEDRDGSLWVITETHLFRFRAATGEQIGAAVTLPGTFLSGPLEDKTGSIWLTTHTGLLRLDPRNPRVPPSEIAKGKFWLSEDTKGEIWLTRPDGVTRPVNQREIFSRPEMKVKAFDVDTVLRDSNGNTWIGTLGQGLGRLWAGFHDGRKMEKFSESEGLSEARVWCFLEDREHNIWVGTQNGLDRFRDEKVTTLTRREGLAGDGVAALAAGPDGTVWGSTPVGLYRIDGVHRDLTLKGTRVLALHVERTNALWAGTNRGIARLQDGKWQYLPTPADIQLTNVTAITGDEDAGVWFVDAYKGLYRRTKGRMTDFSEEPLLKGKSITAAVAGAGKVWFGLSEGDIVVFDGSQFHSYSAADGLGGGSVNTVHIDDQANVWIASERGLSRLEGEKFVTWNTSNGLPGDRVMWILTDNTDRVWLGYSTGVASLSTSELDRAARDPSYRVAFQFLDDADGLKGNPDRQWQAPAVRASDGSLWFKTSEGLAVFDPQHMKTNLVIPPLHIERMVADGTVVNTLQPLRLRPLTRNVEIDYTALSFAEPRNVRFRYMLEGFDSNWRDAGVRRQAFYTNLRPHAYRFRVLACNNDGLWNETGASLDFDLLPAFYQTQWFSLLCALVGIILAWGAYRLRVWQVTSRLQELFDARLKERTRIAQELHDNLIQDVMGISLQIEVTDELLPAGLPAKQPLGRALALCKSALDAGRRALNDLRSAPLSAADLVKSFSQLANEVTRNAETKIDVIVEGHERPLNATAGNDVLQVGRQAISNAFQHARARNIHVLLSYGEESFRLRIEDNGSGIKEESMNLQRPGHYGMLGMKERAERLGGGIFIRSREGEGTEVDLLVPANPLYQNGAPRSVWSVTGGWRYLTGKMGNRGPKQDANSRSDSPGMGYERGKPDDTNS